MVLARTAIVGCLLSLSLLGQGYGGGYSSPPGSGGGGGGGSPAGPPHSTQIDNAGAFGSAGPGTTGNAYVSNGASADPSFKPTGVFNVRLMYGAVPDGSTDNSTAITNAFTASNLVTTGIPTVYFDCDTGTTTCQYNYTGSGNQSNQSYVIATTISCAPGVYLSYGGSANAVDVGSTGRTFSDELPYTIQGCIFTGATSSTEGINVNSFITNTYILNNTFLSVWESNGVQYLLRREQLGIACSRQLLVRP